MSIPLIQLKMPGEVAEESRGGYGYGYPQNRPVNLIGGVPLIQPTIPSGNFTEQYRDEEVYPEQVPKKSKMEKIREAMGGVQEGMSKIRYRREPQVFLMNPSKRIRNSPRNSKPKTRKRFPL